jgi:hypothetical protein
MSILTCLAPANDGKPRDAMIRCGLRKCADPVSVVHAGPLHCPGLLLRLPRWCSGGCMMGDSVVQQCLAASVMMR